MALKGLVIREPWIGMILRGEKVWELRSQPCRHRGRIALIEKGSGEIQGVATLVDDLAPLSRSELLSSIGKHGVPVQQIDEVMKMRWLRPWVLADVVRLSRSVPYQHTSGGSWVNLTDSEEAAVLSDTNNVVRYGSARSLGGPSYTNSKVAFSKKPSTSEPSVKVKQRGNQLAIEIEWEDEDINKPINKPVSDWLELFGLLAALAAMVSMIGFLIHFGLGIVREDVSALAAFKWLVPLAISWFIAGFFMPDEGMG